MRKTTIAFSVAIALLFACKNENAPASSATEPAQTQTTVAASTLTPEQLGELGAKIKRSPNDAEKLLQENGLTEQTFMQAVRKVAENPEESKRYTAAYKKAS